MVWIAGAGVLATDDGGSRRRLVLMQQTRSGYHAVSVGSRWDGLALRSWRDRCRGDRMWWLRA
jgi:hypothetical protein